MVKYKHEGPWGDQGDGTYYNPILESDYCDPDIIRVEDTYYMIASTMQLAPGMAILESKDLVNWRTISYAIPNIAELDPRLNWDQMDAYNQGVYAGSIRYLEWKEQDESGQLVSKSKWFVHVCLCQKGFVVSTADSVEGPWNCSYMLDRHGVELRVNNYGDTCPHWEFNEDGTLKSAYLIVSKMGAWYPRLFQMSLDGKQLLDGDRRFMEMTGDTTRQRSGATPSYAWFQGSDSGDPTGHVLDRTTGEPIRTSNSIPDAHHTLINEQGDIQSIIQATHYPNREGAVIRDVYTAEGAKLYRFNSNTAIGCTTFSGRHGEQERISDYIYIYNNEVWDGQRLPVIHRAKSIYGDKFDASGSYAGAGTAADPGSYESQRMMVNITEPSDTREPNQGGFIDVPEWLSTDGHEHWYWMTQQGNERIGPQCRPCSLMPVTWIDGWPLAGQIEADYYSAGEADIAAAVYDGTGLNGNTCYEIHHPNARIKPGTFTWHAPKPPIKGEYAIMNFQDSDHFGAGGDGGQINSSIDKLSPNWQWNYAPREHYWSLSDKPGCLRLYAFHTTDNSSNFFKVGNTLCQRYINSDLVTAEIKLDITSLCNGQEAGLAHFNGGVSYSTIGIKQDEYGVRTLSYCSESQGVVLDTEHIIFRSTVGIDRVNIFEYSVDGGQSFAAFGERYKLVPGGYKGDMIGIYTYNNQSAGKLDTSYIPDDHYKFGYVDVHYFKYSYSR